MMSDGFTVEAIVAQIRSRIAEEKTRKSSPSQTRSSVSEGPAGDIARGRMRMEEDAVRFADLDLRLENAARNIGQQPFAPPTWRGRLGAWAVQGLRRLLWWYGLPIKEALAQIGLRNREQALRHRNLQEDLFAFGESLHRAVSRIDGLERAAGEARSLQRGVADCEARIGLLADRVDGRWNDLQRSQESAAKDAARRQQEMHEDWSRRDGEIARQLSAWNDQLQQLKAAHGVSESLRTNMALRVAGLAGEAEKEAAAREALAGALETQAGRIRQFDERLQSLGDGIADAMGRAERLEHTTSALNLQLRAEAQARDVLMGVVSGQAERIEQVHGALLARIEAEAQAREVLMGVVGGQAERIEKVHQALSAQLQAEVHTREVLVAAVNGEAERIEQVHQALSAQLQAEVHTREVLAGTVKSQAERIEQVHGALFTHLQAEVHTREVLAGVVNGQADKLQQVADAVAPLAGLPVRVSSLAVTHEKQRSALLLQENRIAMFLREVRHQLPKPLSQKQVRQFNEAPDDAIAAVFAEFEDTFRGPRELVKERQEVYVPRLLEAHAGTGSAPVLDLGCGRGEWLELLADRHLVASGVDANPGMVERCRALGIQATLGDALTHLRSLPDRSLGAVTSFHMVEHLPFEAVIALLDEALRVLRTGGLLILETPNPQNVLVGSYTFWIDPTHCKPIPSETLRFFVEARGFCGAEVWNLQPYPAAIRLPEDPAGIAARFNDCFYGPQDYGIIACRP